MSGRAAKKYGGHMKFHVASRGGGGGFTIIFGFIAGGHVKIVTI